VANTEYYRQLRERRAAGEMPDVDLDDARTHLELLHERRSVAELEQLLVSSLERARAGMLGRPGWA